MKPRRFHIDRAVAAVLTLLIGGAAAADSPLTGDLTFDRIIDVNDFALMYSQVQGTVVLSPSQLAVSDVNHDGTVDLRDVRRGMGVYGRFVHFEVPPFDPVNPARPILLKAMPAFGPPGTLVTLLGSGFGPTPEANVIRLAGQIVPAASASPTSLTFRVPSSGVASGSVTVEVGGLESCGFPFLVGVEPPMRNPGLEVGPEEVGLDIPRASVFPGSRISIPIVVNTGNHDLIGVDMRVSFDPTVLRAVEMEARPVVQFGQHFYRCIDNTTGVIAAAVGVGRTASGLAVADVVFDVIGTPGRIGVVSARLNAFTDMTNPLAASTSFPRFVPSSESFVLVGDGSVSETIRLLDAPLVHASASVLPDGRVLVAGGDRGIAGAPALADVVFFDPQTSTVQAAGFSLNQARSRHSATPLPDGRILVAAGRGPSGALRSLEIFEPATGAFRLLARSLGVARSEHAAVLLPDGRVAFVGGIGSSNAPVATVEIFDPSTERVTTLPTPLSIPRRGPSAVAGIPSLRPTEILVTGGVDLQANEIHLGDSEVYDVTTSVTRRIDPGSGSRIGALHRATQLSTGEVIVTGSDSASEFVHDDDEFEFDESVDLQEPRVGHFALSLQGGRMLVGGGYLDSSSRSILRSTEILATDRRGDRVSLVGPRLVVSRAEAAAVTLQDGRVVVVGGYLFSGGATPVLEVLRP